MSNSDVLIGSIEHLHLRQCEDKIIVSCGKLYRGNSHITTSDAIVLGSMRGKRLKSWTLKIRKKGLTVLLTEERNPCYKPRVIARLNFKANRETKACSNGIEVVVAW